MDNQFFLYWKGWFFKSQMLLISWLERRWPQLSQLISVYTMLVFAADCGSGYNFTWGRPPFIPLPEYLRSETSTRVLFSLIPMSLHTHGAQTALTFQHLFCFHENCRDFSSSSIRNVNGILMAIILNRYFIFVYFYNNIAPSVNSRTFYPLLSFPTYSMFYSFRWIYSLLKLI